MKLARTSKFIITKYSDPFLCIISPANLQIFNV
jgi:hypothetical protein